MSVYDQPSVSGIWWLDPGKLVLRFILPIYAFVALVVPALWPELIVLRGRSYMDSEYVMLGALALLVMGAAATLGSAIRWSDQAPAAPFAINERFLLTIGVLALLAYVIWFWPVLSTGQLDLERDALNQTPGVTSFTQLGVTYVICYLYVTQRTGQQLSRLARLIFRALLVFALVRVYLSSERLALIELAVPIAVLMLTYHQPRGRAGRALFKVVSRYGPLLGIPLLLAFFTATELVRSWSYHSFKQDISLLDYMISRITTYYYTALNNGAGLLVTSPGPDYDLVFIGEWVYRLPFGIGAFFWSNLGRVDMPHEVFLARFGDPEFNNMSGIYPVMFDVGIVGGLIYFGVLGLGMGAMYQLARRERPLGVLLLPSIIVACIEVLRIMYLNNTRCFLVLIGALLASTQLRARRERTAAVYAGGGRKPLSAAAEVSDSFAPHRLR